MRINVQKLKLRDSLVSKKAHYSRSSKSFKKLYGESVEVDAATVNRWRKEQLKTLLEKYEPDDAFNADEMALYYKLLFDKSLVLKGKENVHGKTRSK